VRDGGRSSGERIIDKHLVSAGEIERQFGGRDFLASNMFRKSIRHLKVETN
jgi:hypothetical protein